MSRALRARVVRAVTFGLIRYATRVANVWLRAENPDDIAFVVKRGIGNTACSTAGVDQNWFSAQPPPAGTVPGAAFVGRLIRSKGVATLVAAQDILHERGVVIDLALYGASDASNPDTVTHACPVDRATRSFMARRCR